MIEVKVVREPKEFEPFDLVLRCTDENAHRNLIYIFNGLLSHWDNRGNNPWPAKGTVKEILLQLEQAKNT